MTKNHLGKNRVVVTCKSKCAQIPFSQYSKKLVGGNSLCLLFITTPVQIGNWFLSDFPINRLNRTLRRLWKVQQRPRRISSRPYGSHIFCKAAMNRLYVGAIEDDVALDVILARWSHLVSLVFLVGISSVKIKNRHRYIFRSLSAHFPLVCRSFSSTFSSSVYSDLAKIK